MSNESILGLVKPFAFVQNFKRKLVVDFDQQMGARKKSSLNCAKYKKQNKFI
jgi:hypothetical protein